MAAPLQLAGAPEKAPQPQKALKYRYDAFIEEWASEECVVMIARKPFAAGGMRWCYKMYEIDKGGKHAPGVAKVFKDDAVEEDDDEDIAKSYFDEAMTQTVADSFAQQFNQVLGDDPENERLKCRFLPVRVMQFYGKTGPHALCNCEPYLQGEYVKHNDNDGHVETAQEVPQAFSHFTWEYSNQLILVCDIQGVDNYFTDPQIHSHDGNSFGMGNLGQEGIDRFLETHQCNSMCRKLGLVVPERNPDKTWKVGRGSIAVSRITKKSFASDSSSQGPTWTAKKYDGAVTDAVTRVTKKRGKGEAEGPNSAPAVELTQQQLSTLQAKLVMLIQQHGSMNQLLLSPQRAPRKPPPRPDRVQQRPWSPDPRSGRISPLRERQSSPLHRPQSPMAINNRPQSPSGPKRTSEGGSSAAKISSSYDLMPLRPGVGAGDQRSLRDVDRARKMKLLASAGASDRNIGHNLQQGVSRTSSNGSDLEERQAGSRYDRSVSPVRVHGAQRTDSGEGPRYYSGSGAVGPRYSGTGAGPRYAGARDSGRESGSAVRYDNSGERRRRSRDVSPRPQIPSERVLNADEDKFGSPLSPQDVPDPESAKVSSWKSQMSSSSSNLLMPGHSAICKFCNVAGAVYDISNNGPVHGRHCERWADKAPLRRRDSSPVLTQQERIRLALIEKGGGANAMMGGSMKNLVVTGSRNKVTTGEKGLSEEDQKKKAMLHKQMLELKKQLEEQLQRLQHTALVNKDPAAAGREGRGGSGTPKLRGSADSHDSGRGSGYDRL